MFKKIVLVSALLLALTAAIFSISGIVSLFSGAAIAVGLMAFAIEVGKVVSISVLYRYRQQMSRVLRTYLTIALILASGITTLGIYGYLSAAYSSVAIGARQNETQITLVTSQEQSVDDQIARLTERSKGMEKFRADQEDRLNRLVGHNGLRDQQAAVARSEKELEAIQTQITTLSMRRDSLETAKTSYQGKITSDAHIGPFYYFAKAVNIPLDDIVKWFILAIVAVFDPLSICLIFAYNVILKNEKEKIIPEIVPVIDTLPEPIKEEVTDIVVEDKTSHQEIFNGNHLGGGGISLS